MTQNILNPISVEGEIPNSSTPPFLSSHNLTAKIFFLFFVVINLFLLVICISELVDSHFKICKYLSDDVGFGSFNSSCPIWFQWYGESIEIIHLIMVIFAMTLYVLPVIFYNAIFEGARTKLKVAQNVQELRLAKINIFLVCLLPVLLIFVVILLQHNIKAQ